MHSICEIIEKVSIGNINVSIKVEDVRSDWWCTASFHEQKKNHWCPFSNI
jgi:hypothetical protein